MIVEFLKSFSKDLDKVQPKSTRIMVKEVIELMETSASISSIPGTIKLKGHKNAYRTRIGDYRLGFFLIDGKTIQLARFLHRKDIYNLFP